MKNLILFLFLIVSTSLYIQTSFSQSNENQNYQPLRISGFCGPISHFTIFDGSFANYIGGGGALLFNNSFFIGGFGMGLTNDIRVPDENLIKLYFDPKEKYFFQSSMGGIQTGYIFNWKKIIDPILGINGFWGNIAICDKDYNTEISSPIWFIQPVGEIEINISKYIRISFIGGYRIMANIDKLKGFNNENFSAITAGFSLKFGWFQ